MLWAQDSAGRWASLFTTSSACVPSAGRPTKYFPVPVALMDGIIGILDILTKLFPQMAVCDTVSGGPGDDS